MHIAFAMVSTLVVSFLLATGLVLWMQPSNAFQTVKNGKRSFGWTPCRIPIRVSLSSSPNSSDINYIALTREVGKNDKLFEAIQSHSKLQDKLGNVRLVEIPCIEHADGPDTEALPATLASTPYDYICITSPEAAAVFARAYAQSKTIDGSSAAALGRIVAVGKATEEALKQRGFDVAFVPSKATAKVLVSELSPVEAKEKRKTTILYPASAQAKPALQEGLEQRGEFAVTRLNTYDTVPAKWTKEQIDLARKCKVVCFGSPSAVNAWLQNLESDEGHTVGTRTRVLAACIGETSAAGCRQMQWEESSIFYPEKPGIEGWADAVVQALEGVNAYSL